MFLRLPSFNILNKVITFSLAIFTSAILLLALLTPSAYSQASFKTTDPCKVGPCIEGITSQFKGNTSNAVIGVILNFANLLTMICVAVTVIVVVYQGWKIMTSNGDAKKYEEGLKGILYAIIGLVVSVLAYGVVQAIINILPTLKF
jgi:Type IV secretion system pilin